MQLDGVITAIVTPFNDQGEVDYEAFGRLLEHQLEVGVKGFVPCGSTGEFYALSTDERNQVCQFVIDRVGDRAQLIAGVNAGSTRDVIAYTLAVKAMGYEAVLAAPPYYSMPAPEELVAHFRAILDATDMKMVLYNYPIKTGVEICRHVLDAFQDDERVIAIKDSSGVVQRAVEITTDYAGKYQLSNGSDDVTLDFYLWGAKSWICGPANAFAKQCVELHDRAIAGDIAGARDVMRALFPAMNSLESGKFIQKVKYGAELCGVPVGDTRAPLYPLNAAEKAEFKRAFEIANDAPVAAAAE